MTVLATVLVPLISAASMLGLGYRFREPIMKVLGPVLKPIMKVLGPVLKPVMKVLKPIANFITKVYPHVNVGLILKASVVLAYVVAAAFAITITLNFGGPLAFASVMLSISCMIGRSGYNYYKECRSDAKLKELRNPVDEIVEQNLDGMTNEDFKKYIEPLDKIVQRRLGSESHDNLKTSASGQSQSESQYSIARIANKHGINSEIEMSRRAATVDSDMTETEEITFAPAGRAA